MTFWDGTRWVPEPSLSHTRAPSRTAMWIATAVMLMGLLALIAPFELVGAANRPVRQQVTVSCEPSPCAVGGELTVRGSGFAPSANGQMVFVWLGYPDDYCGRDMCHGRYFNPWVSDDGTFSQTFADALPGEGTGELAAFQYSPKRDKWLTVASLSYSTY